MFENIQQKEVLILAKMSERIKLLRTTSGLTQEEFGKIFGIVKSTVSLYESGRSCPNDQIKLQICKYFDVPMDFLLGISNSSNNDDAELKRNLITDGCAHSRFKDLAKIRNKSFKTLSLETGLDEETLENWFLNDVPSLSQLILIAEHLDTSIDYLMGRENNFNMMSHENNEVIYYYKQLKKMDKQWILGQMIDLIKKYEQEEDAFISSVAADVRKVSGK